MTKEAVAMMHSPNSAVPSPTSSIVSAQNAHLAAVGAHQHPRAKSKLLLFEVNFAGGRSAFRSGEKITGWVTVETRGPVYAASYQIECTGYSEVPDHSSAIPGNAKPRFYRNHLAMKESLLPMSHLLEKRCFEFQLPRWLPHSVECEDLGYLRYCCRAIATFSGNGDSNSTAGTADYDDVIEGIRFFTVIEDVDLNAPAVALRCKFDEVSHTSVDNLISKLLKDEVKASLMLKKDAYVPGENVYCQLSVHSSSNTIPVHKIMLRLVQRTTALGSNNRQVANRSRFVLQEQVTSDSEDSGRYWSAKHKLHIPGVVPTTLVNPHFQHPIIIDYAIQMCVSLGFNRVPVKDLTLDCPIVIGTVPKLDSPGDLLAPLEASFVESSRCDIPCGGHRERRGSKSGFLAPFQSKREPSGYRGPQLQCALYCVYYPTISIYRKKQSASGLKSILKVKHSSMDALDVKEPQEQQQRDQSRPAVLDRPAGMKRSTSLGWSYYETPL